MTLQKDTGILQPFFISYLKNVVLNGTRWDKT